MYTASDLRKGLKVILDNQPWIITDFQFNKPGKGAAIYSCRLKNMLTGSTTTRNFRSNDTFEKPDLSQKVVRFSYDDGAHSIFMDENFEQLELSADVLGINRYFLEEDIECEVLFFNGQPIEVTLPTFVERRVIKTEPGAKGNSAAGNVTKPAVIESGYELQVPLFINEGDVVRIDTRTGAYSDRVNR